MTDRTNRWQDYYDRYRTDWEQTNPNRSWDQVEHGYRYSWESAQNPHYRDREYGDVEHDLQQHWSAYDRDPHRDDTGTQVEHARDNFKDSVRQGWERAKREFRKHTSRQFRIAVVRMVLRFDRVRACWTMACCHQPSDKMTSTVPWDALLRIYNLHQARERVNLSFDQCPATEQHAEGTQGTRYHFASADLPNSHGDSTTMPAPARLGHQVTPLPRP